MKIIVTYKTTYGSAGQYAKWIAEALECEAVEVGKIKLKTLLDFDTIIHVGGLYASNVSGFKKIGRQMKALQGKHIVLCMVGMTDPTNWENYREVFEHNVPEQYRDAVKPFALRGSQLFSQMSSPHRIMMRIPLLSAEKKPENERTEEDRLFIDSFGKDVNFVAREYTDNVVKYVKDIEWRLR